MLYVIKNCNYFRFNNILKLNYLKPLFSNKLTKTSYTAELFLIRDN